MAYQQQQLDPLPIPDAKELPEAQQKPPDMTPNVPPGAGFASKPAAGAMYADQILKGVMAGRLINEQKKLKTAQMEVGTARDQHNGYAEQYQRAIDNGMDQNSEEFKQLKGRVASTWEDYLKAAEKYTAPEKGAKKGKKEGGGKEGGPSMIHAAMQHIAGTNDPHLFTQAMIQNLRKSGSPALAYTQDAARKQQLQEGDQRLQINKGTLEDQAHARAQQADVEALRKQREEAVKKGDTKAQVEAEKQLAAYGVNIAEVKSVEERKADENIAHARVSATEKLGKGTNQDQLDPLEQASIGYHPSGDGFEFYNKEVRTPANPNGKYKNSQEAWIAYERNQRAMTNFGRGGGGSAAALSAKDVQVYLKGALSSDVGVQRLKREFPELAGKLHVLQGNEEPDPSVVAAVRQSKIMGWNAKQDAEADRSTAMKKAYGVAYKNMSPEDQAMAQELFVSKDEDGNISLNSPEYWAPASEDHWYSHSKIKTASGHEYDPQQARQKYTQFVGRMRSMLKQLYPGADESAINEALGLADGPGEPPSDNLKVHQFAGIKAVTVSDPETGESRKANLTYSQAVAMENKGLTVSY